MSESVIALAPGKSDRQLAEEYRVQLQVVAAPLIDLLNKAKGDGLSIGFNFAPDNYGRVVMKDINVVKPL